MGLDFIAYRNWPYKKIFKYLYSSLNSQRFELKVCNTVSVHSVTIIIIINLYHLYAGYLHLHT
jgi:hypothetical protein